MKLRTLVCWLTAALISSPVSAVTIVNYNSRPVDFDIYDAPTCGVDHFVSGSIGEYGGTSSWDGAASLLYPGERICVAIQSFASATMIANNLSSNPYCVVSVRDNGFLMGIRLDLSASCY